ARLTRWRVLRTEPRVPLVPDAVDVPGALARDPDRLLREIRLTIAFNGHLACGLACTVRVVAAEWVVLAVRTWHFRSSIDFVRGHHHGDPHPIEPAKRFQHIRSYHTIDF